jgi:hypothetical protein
MSDLRLAIVFSSPHQNYSSGNKRRAAAISLVTEILLAVLFGLRDQLDFKENVNVYHVSPGSLGIEHKTEGSRRVAQLAIGFQGYSKTRGRRACGQE